MKSGTYSEDITIGTYGITLTTGEDAVIEGDITVLDTAGQVIVAWVNDLGNADRSMQARFLGEPGTPFTITGRDARASGIEATLGLAGHTPVWSWDIGYRGEFAGETVSHMFQGRVSFGF